MSTGFNPYYQGSSGITAKISGGRLIDSPTIGDLTAGASYYFDGTDDKVQVADADALSIIGQGTDGSWAVEVFFRADDGAASSDRLVSKGTAEYSFGLSDCSINSSAITYPTAMDNSSYADQWMHLMLVGNGSLMEQFINGVSQGTTDCTASAVTGSADLRFGLETDDSGDFNGEIGRVRLFNDALTDDEVRILYNGGAVPQDRQDELVGEWLSSGVTAGAWIESSGNNFTGEVTGATAINEKANILRTDQNLVADLQSGASFNFDGTDDYLSNGSFPAIGLDSDYSITAWVKVNSTLDGFDGIVMWGDSAQYESRGLVIDGNEKLASSHYQDNISGNSVVPTNEWFHAAIAVVASTGGVSIYLNGVLDGTGSHNTPFTEFTGTNVNIGITHPGGGESLDGQISQVRIHNRALSAAEVRAAYNGQAVGFEYVGASQDELFTAGSESHSSWHAGSGLGAAPATDSTNYTVGSASISFTGAGDIGSSSNYWTGQSGVLGAGNGTGKRYRAQLDVATTNETGTVYIGSGYVPAVTFDAANNTVTSDSTYNRNVTSSVSSVSAAGGSKSWYRITVEFGQYLYSNGNYFTIGADASCGSVNVDNVSVTQIGCVAEFMPSGVGHNQWSDSSGNGLDGAVSGATAVNAPDVQRVKLAGVTGETQKENFIPAGYIIQDVITAETAGNDVSGFNIGFGDGDETIVADVTVAASTTTSQTIAASVATLTADDTIYISATPTTGWNNGSVDIYFTLRRVA